MLGLAPSSAPLRGPSTIYSFSSFVSGRNTKSIGVLAVDAAGDTSVEAVVEVRNFLRTFAYF